MNQPRIWQSAAIELIEFLFSRLPLPQISIGARSLDRVVDR